MDKIIIASVTQFNILSAITYQAILSFDIRMDTDNTGIITIIDDALIQCNFWIGIHRRLIGNNILVSIFYYCKPEQVVLTLSAEINAGPPCRKITIGIIEPVSPENNSCTVI